MAHHSTLNEQAQFEINHANELISEGKYYHAAGKQNGTKTDIKKIAKDQQAKSTDDKQDESKVISPDQIYEKLHELTLADEAAVTDEDKTMFDTVAWLKDHEKNGKVHNRVTRFFEHAIEKIHPSKVAVPGRDDEIVLPTDFGKDKWEWNQVAFALLNAPFRVKVSKIRKILYAENFESQTNQHELVHLVKFMQFFDNQLDEANKLKSEVLMQRSKIFGKRFIVSTEYERYSEYLHGAIVEGLNGNLQKFKRGVLYAFLELEAVMTDEERESAALVNEYVDSAQDEFLALSRALETANRDEVSGDEGCFYAQLMMYVEQALPQKDLSSLLSLWSKKTLDKLAGEWMSFYAANLSLMSPLDMDPSGVEVYSRSRAARKTVA